MNKLILFLLSFSLSYTAFARSGDEVGNGDGIAENNFLFAYQSMNDLINLCLKLESCALSGQQRFILTKVLEHLPGEYRNKKQLQFLSGRKYPGFFVIHGQTRIAKTGDTVGSPIFVNTDMLYYRNDLGEEEAVSIPSAVSVLVHEFGHHHGVKDEAWLDALGAKVGRLVKRNLYSNNIYFLNSRFLVQWISSISEKLPTNASQLMLSDDAAMYDLSKKLKQSLYCYTEENSLKRKSKPIGFGVFNVHWASVTTQSILGNLVLYCKDKTTEGIRETVGDAFRLNYRTIQRSIDGRAVSRFMANSFVFQQIPCARDPRRCEQRKYEYEQWKIKNQEERK